MLSGMNEKRKVLEMQTASEANLQNLGVFLLGCNSFATSNFCSILGIQSHCSLVNKAVGADPCQKTNLASCQSQRIKIGLRDVGVGLHEEKCFVVVN